MKEFQAFKAFKESMATEPAKAPVVTEPVTVNQKAPALPVATQPEPVVPQQPAAPQVLSSVTQDDLNYIRQMRAQEGERLKAFHQMIMADNPALTKEMVEAMDVSVLSALAGQTRNRHAVRMAPGNDAAESPGKRFQRNAASFDFDAFCKTRNSN